MQRNTVQRQIILDALKIVRDHPSVEDVHNEVTKMHPSISKSTVYRNLRQLAEHGIIRYIALPDELERYDKNTHLHYHFKCKMCNGIFDVDIDHLGDLNAAVQAQHGYQVDAHDVVFSGVCLKCKT